MSSISWHHIHPAINAVLNATCAVLLMFGYRAIKRGDRVAHHKIMMAAFYVSAVFLASYLARFATTGAHYYPHQGVDKIVYLVLLFSHMALAVVVVPLVLRSIYLATKGRIPEHKRLVKFTWPIWMYVSVTGVIVYLMLYQLAPRLLAAS